MKNSFIKTLILLVALLCTGVLHAQTYDNTDKGILRTFLNIGNNWSLVGISAADKSNWESSDNWLTAINSPDGSFGPNTVGVGWDDQNPKRLKFVGWKSKGLTGSINFNSCSALTNVNLSGNNLTSVSFSECSEVLGVDVSLNKLTSLTFSNCAKVGTVLCQSNQLTSLTFTNCPALGILYCEGNKLSAITGLTHKPGTVSCYDNAFLLSNLPVPFNKNNKDDVSSGGYKYVPQHADVASTLTSNVVDLSSQNTINGTKTNFFWYYKDGQGNWVQFQDDFYTNEDGKFTFNYAVNTQIACIMTNTSFPGFTTNSPEISPKHDHLQWLATMNITGPTYKGYSAGDKAVLRAFLRQKDGNDWNGAKLGISASDTAQWSVADGWVEKVQGISWTDVIPKRLATIAWSNKSLTGNLNASNCAGLTTLDCSNNRLTSVNATGCTALTTLNAANNRMLLSELYKTLQGVNTTVTTTRTLDPQSPVFFESKMININEIVDLSSELTIGGATTTYTVKRGAADAIVGTDYTYNSGKITFLKGGDYTVELTNANVKNSDSNNAKVITGTVKVGSVGVTFNAKGGKVDPETIEVASGGTIADNALPTPLWSGYIFDGWYRDEGYTTKWTSGTTITTSITLYAKWLATVTFDANAQGASVSPTSKNIAVGTAIGELPTPTYPGYNFAGWYTETTSNAWTASTSVTAPVTLYAKWTATVTFDARGGVVSPLTKEVVVGTSIDVIPTATRTGYKFAGWYKEEACINEWLDGTTVSAAMKLYAKWNVVVTLNAREGEVTPSILEVAEGGTLVSIPGATREGYKFDGWCTDEAATLAWNSSTTVSAPLTLYAKWLVVVTFDPQGGIATYLKKELPENGKLTELPQAWHEEYQFGGWCRNKQGTNEWDLNTPVPLPMTLYAKWLATVTYIASGGDVTPASQEVALGNIITNMPVPTRTGYTFGGWYKDEACTNAWTSGTLVTGNMMLYAKWTNTVVVTFNPMEGVLDPLTMTVTQGSKINPQPLPTRAGYNFAGWYTESTYVTAWNFDTPVNSAMTLYAKWDPVSGYDDLLKIDIKLYPNPFANQLHVTGAEACVLRIMNSVGKVVLVKNVTGNEEVVDLSNLAVGVYFFRFEKDGKSLTMKGIKE